MVSAPASFANCGAGRPQSQTGLPGAPAIFLRYLQQWYATHRHTDWLSAQAQMLFSSGSVLLPPVAALSHAPQA